MEIYLERDSAISPLSEDLQNLRTKYSASLSDGSFCQELVNYACELVKQNVSHRVALSVLYDYVNTAYLDKME